MPEMSDSDFFAAGAPQPSSMSDDDFMSMGAKSAQPDNSGILQNTILPSLARNDSPMSTLFQGAGAVAGKGMTALKNAVQSIPGVIPTESAIGSAAESATKPVANALDSTSAGQWIGDKLMGGADDISTLAAAHPEAAANLKAATQLNMAAPMVESGLNVARGASSILGDMGETGMGASPNKVPAPVYDPILTHSAISDAYGAAKAGTRPYYNLMKDIGAGETADASDLKPALDSMIADIQNTPFHEATSELPYLKQQAAKIGDDGTMPLNDMVKLKQNLNSNFNPKRFAQGSDTPYSAVGDIVDTSLDDAATRIPEFGEAKSLADKNWLNTVKSPFEDNTVLKKIWKPEDYYAKKSVDSGMLENLPDPTVQRASGMLKNVKTPVQLDAIRRVLPPDLADTFSQAKIQDVIQNEGAGRLASAGKAITGIPGIITSPFKGTANV